MEMNKSILYFATFLFSIPQLSCARVTDDEALAHVPETAPRTWILAGKKDDFVKFSSSGRGKAYFDIIRKDFDTVWMDWAFPSEPETYGDPDPRKRTGDKVDKWRAMQDICGQVTGVAEAAVLLWHTTGEEKYLEKAKHFLLSAADWDPLGSTGIDYNDEAHFRLFRKLPEIYDQLRSELSDTEREKVIMHLRARGNRNIASIKEHGVAELERNSVEMSPDSHSVRFMAMTGQAGLALIEDIPEAKDWYTFAYIWFRDVFTPWGGSDGGWAEGPTYWKGTFEHAVFQDALLAIGDPLAYSQPFWKNTGYFPLYNVTHYPSTGFGDISNAGQFNMEPGVKDFLDHLGRVTGNGYFLAYTEDYSDPRALPIEMGMAELYRTYPTATEHWIREFIASKMKMPDKASLSELPNARYFKDIGWVSMHSNLADPENDIMLTFKSSPYGSFSHSHADQNSFILNAFGRELAINSGYREYHRSQMHKYYTRQTISKNNILINRRGQEVQDKSATGRITRFDKSDRAVWTTGDATVAFNTMQKDQDEIKSVVRDIVFIDNRYFVIRDHAHLDNPGRMDWLLHAKEPISYHEIDGSVVIENKGAHLFVRLLAENNNLLMDSWTGFPVEPDPKYKDINFINSAVYLRSPAVDQAHFRANTQNDRDVQTIHAVLWPSLEAADHASLKAHLDGTTLIVQRPDGITDRIQIGDDSLSITSD